MQPNPRPACSSVGGVETDTLLMRESIRVSQKPFRSKDWGRLFKGDDFEVLTVGQDQKYWGTEEETHIR